MMTDLSIRVLPMDSTAVTYGCVWIPLCKANLPAGSRTGGRLLRKKLSYREMTQTAANHDYLNDQRGHSTGEGCIRILFTCIHIDLKTQPFRSEVYFRWTLDNH